MRTLPPIGLQQYLPFTVLKQPPMIVVALTVQFGLALQQYLPFTVLKLNGFTSSNYMQLEVATVLTVYGIET